MPQRQEQTQLQIFWTTLIRVVLTAVPMEILVIFPVPSLPKQFHKLLPGRPQYFNSKNNMVSNFIFRSSFCSDSFANFGAVFDSTPAVPQTVTPSQDAFLLDDLLAPAPVGPSSMPFNAFSTNVMPPGNHLTID